jgi:CRISPR-associated protein Cmr3
MIWHFEPCDTWFFKEAKPMNGEGGNESLSVFPPPARTLMGAVRTSLGDRAGVQWDKYAQGDGTAHQIKGLDLIEAIGDATHMGKLKLRGPWITKNKKRLIPAPLHLLRRVDNKGEHAAYEKMCVGGAVVCDLGTVRLPEMPQDRKGLVSIEGWLLDEKTYEAVLGGTHPEQPPLDPKSVFAGEGRTGIALEREKRTVKEGALYQTRHVRLCEGFAIAAEVTGVDEALRPTGVTLARLGGEGRATAITLEKENRLKPLAASTAPKGAKGLLLSLITHADLNGDWIFDGFKKESIEGIDSWSGELFGIRLRVVSAILGKAVREGGWDMAARKPRAVKSLIPAGSVWFCECDDPAAAIKALAGKQIGQETELGRGELAAGYWI